MERWLQVVGYEGRYEVSDLGRVRSLRCSPQDTLRKNPIFIGTKPEADRYVRVYLGRPGEKTRKVRVHTLVLEGFIGPRPVGMEGCHWDDDRSNNRLTNLQWGTHGDNGADAKRNGRSCNRTPVRGTDHVAAKLTDDGVRCIRAEPHFPGVIQMLARAFDVSEPTIAQVRKGKAWKHVIDPFEKAA